MTRTVGEIVKRRRISKGLTVRQLADIAQISPATVFRTEKNVNNKHKSTLVLIAKALDTTASEIMDEACGITKNDG